MAFFSPLFTFPSNPNISLGPIWIEGGRVEGSKVELVKNRLILGKFYSTPLPPPQSKRTIRFLGFVILRKS